MTTYADHVADLRQQREPLIEERARLSSLPRDRGIVQTIVKQTIQHWHAEGAAHVERELRKIAQGGVHALLVAQGLVAPSTAPVPQPFSLPLGPMLVAVLGVDAVEHALLRFVDQTPAGIPARERDARIAEIDEELDALEMDEEQTIVQAGRAGEHIARRRDARPSVILRVVTDINRREKAAR